MKKRGGRKERWEGWREGRDGERSMEREAKGEKGQYLTAGRLQAITGSEWELNVIDRIMTCYYGKPV